MKEKIFDALKAKYANLGFGSKALDGVAEYLVKTVEKEDDIENAISGVEPLLKSFQSDIDRVRTEKSALQSQLDEMKKAIPPAKEKEDKSDEHFDAEAFKADLLKTIREEQAEVLKQSEQAAQRAATIVAKAKEFGIPEKFVEKLNISQEADLDEYFKGVKQDLIDAGFEFSEPPAQGGGVSSDGNDIAKLIDNGTAQIVKSQNK